MRRIELRMFIAFCLLLGVAFVVMAADMAKPKGTEVTVTGKVTCTNCKLANPDKTCPQGCCEMCIKSGDPAMLTDGKGNMYILLTSEKGVTLMNEERIKFVNTNVVVKGVLVKGKGIQGIYVDSMEKAR
jgi:hypothetical protein